MGVSAHMMFRFARLWGQSRDNNDCGRKSYKEDILLFPLPRPGLALILPPLHGPDLRAASQEKHTARSLRIRSNEEKQLTVSEHGRRKVRPQGYDRRLGAKNWKWLLIIKVQFESSDTRNLAHRVTRLTKSSRFIPSWNAHTHVYARIHITIFF